MIRWADVPWMSIVLCVCCNIDLSLWLLQLWAQWQIAGDSLSNAPTDIVVNSPFFNTTMVSVFQLNHVAVFRTLSLLLCSGWWMVQAQSVHHHHSARCRRRVCDHAVASVLHRVFRRCHQARSQARNSAPSSKGLGLGRRRN
jgi:hypothetical protein